MRDTVESLKTNKYTISIEDIAKMVEVLKSPTPFSLEELKRAEEKITAYSNDNINHPSHYTSTKYEVIDIIEAFELNYHLGNVAKYLLRAGRKGDKVEDLKKARWYLDREIKSLEGEANG